MTLGKTLGEIESIPAREMMEWRAMYDIEPWGERRADLRAGIVASTTYNVNRGKGPAASATEFMPDFEEKKPQSVAEMQARFLTVSGAKLND